MPSFVTLEFDALQPPRDLHRDGTPFARQALARAQALIDKHDAWVDRQLSAWVADDETTESVSAFWARMNEVLRQHNWQRNRLLEGGLPGRPPRSMPSMLKIAQHHGLVDEAPYCVRCEFEPEDATWRQVRGQLQKAHIIDRVFDGLDLVSNLLPLCVTCHKLQPIFKAGDEAKALAWFLDRSSFRNLIPKGDPS